jgi:hypothetical protein
MITVKNFIWNHFVLKYFQGWLDDYVNDNTYETTKEHEDYRWSDAE